jgi:hypothetical protein
MPTLFASTLSKSHKPTAQSPTLPKSLQSQRKTKLVLKISKRFKKNKKQQADGTTPAPNKGLAKWRING